MKLALQRAFTLGRNYQEYLDDGFHEYAETVKEKCDQLIMDTMFPVESVEQELDK